MSTKTKNLELIKPELTDAADITSYNTNWDKIDDKLGSYHVTSYTELSQFGLSDEEMSSIDFANNIDKILTKLDGTASTLMFIVQNDIHPNLHASVVKKLAADTEIAFTTDSHAGWVFIRFSGEMYRPVLIEVNLETANYYDSVWTCVYNKGAEGNKITAFKSNSETYASFMSDWVSSNKLPRDGVYLLKLRTWQQALVQWDGSSEILLPGFIETTDNAVILHDQRITTEGYIKRQSTTLYTGLSPHTSIETQHTTYFYYKRISGITTAKEAVTPYGGDVTIE